MKYCGYIKLATLEYPRYMFDILGEHPDIQYSSPEYGEFPHPPTYALVLISQKPAFDPNTHIAEQIEPVQENGEWRQAWSVRPLTQEEIAFSQLMTNKIELQRLQTLEAERLMQERLASGAPLMSVTFI
jgi:hypothetical protein